MLVDIISFLFVVFVFAIVLRAILAGIMGSNRVKERKFTRIFVIAGFLFGSFGIYATMNVSPITPLSALPLKFISLIIASVIVYVIVRFSDTSELRKNGTKKESKYMWENIMDSL